ncbi:MAG: DUF2442 domain-containing protein [Bacteroidales bacterium]|nr:DUF2442 domain-containing protein [Bacteroidales bacterium]
MDLVWVTDAKYIKGHIIELTFNDDSKKTLDFSGIINRRKEVYAPLLDVNVFKNFDLGGWTLTWLDNRIDIAPESLYEA